MIQKRTKWILNEYEWSSQWQGVGARRAKTPSFKVWHWDCQYLCKGLLILLLCFSFPLPPFYFFPSSSTYRSAHTTGSFLASVPVLPHVLVWSEQHQKRQVGVTTSCWIRPFISRQKGGAAYRHPCFKNPCFKGGWSSPAQPNESQPQKWL